MSTLKDVAALAGVSQSTVSIVLKGNGNARKISEETQQKVLAAAQELDYKANLSAQLLREGLGSKTLITLFWASDIRVHMLSRFLNGLQKSLIKNNYPCEIQIKPYINNHLHETLTYQTTIACNGIIICNASEKDMEFLETFNTNIPIVLYNRYSNKYATINMDDATIGRLPAEIFFKHQKQRPALIKAPATFNGMNIRTNVFEYQLHEYGLKSIITISSEDSMSGGYDAAMKLCNMSPLPDCLFCTSDLLALGALKAFHEKGISIPEDIELIAIGNGNRDQQEFAIPSLSVINLPMEDMASECLKRIFRCLNDFDYTPDSIKLPITYIARESCPE